MTADPPQPGTNATDQAAYLTAGTHTVSYFYDAQNCATYATGSVNLSGMHAVVLSVI